MGQLERIAVAQVNEPPLDHERVVKLLNALRQRTRREVAIATIGLGGCFSSEMWRALELLAAERGALDEREIATSIWSRQRPAGLSFAIKTPQNEALP